MPSVSVWFHLPGIVHRVLSRWSSQQRMGRNQQPKGGGYAGNKGNKTYASGGRRGGSNKQQAVDSATALGLGVPPQNTMLAGMAGLGMVQQNPLDSLSDLLGRTLWQGLVASVELAYSPQTVGTISSNLLPFLGAHSSRMLLSNLLSSCGAQVDYSHQVR